VALVETLIVVFIFAVPVVPIELYAVHVITAAVDDPEETVKF
jgi:hypothetical protein